MNWFIFLSVILVLLFQEGQSCLKRRSTDDVCECSDFLDLAASMFQRNNVLFSEGSGCVRNVTCGAHYFTYLTTRFNVSEISAPDDMSKNSNRADLQTVELEGNSSAPTGPPLDLFSFFGLDCENSKWYATKYPAGLEYVDINGELKYLGGGGEFNGKKSEIMKFAW
ncbi:hypothetical protein GCK72_003898 [Caenorhabditis remanei]|uniref:Uncharacterized protein n=1 Tax=Caenorhabditis remanei TaxID=31234 RepID=A0A6A5HC19_CAERE|nr:hypothetical protein GCK72_003898 [Caenorhabditis remanei]KAF1763952.1 hypothetical protein GCK72_003898 [Caenorhabditis remanei]